MKKFTVDIETRSLLNLKEVRGLVYCLSKFTEITVISLCDEDFNTISYSLYEKETHNNLYVITELLKDDENIFFAHNGLNFDFLALEHKLKLDIKYAIDTLSLFSPYLNERVLNLASIAIQLGRKKDEKGEELIRILSLPKFYLYKGIKEPLEAYLNRTCRKGFNDCFRQPTEKQAREFTTYCENDAIELMYMVKNIPSNLDIEMYSLDRKINKAGICVDIELLNKILEQGQVVEEKTLQKVDVDFKVLSSTVKFLKLAKTYGVELENCRADYLERCLESSISKEFKTLIKARLALSKRSDSKALTLKDYLLQDKLYNALIIDGAHTGRHTSKGVQIHNLKGDNEGIAWKTLDKLLSGNDLDEPEEIQVLMRLCFTPSKGKNFFICDFSGIEARIVVFLLDDHEKSEKYRNGFDFYKELAAKLYNVNIEVVTDNQRKVGKVAVLGCGYGMGVKRFIEYALSWGLSINEALALLAVETFRDNNYLVAGVRTGKTYENVQIRKGGVWKDLQNAMMQVIQGKENFLVVAKCVIYKELEDIFITLPSGRNLFYRNACIKLCKDIEDDNEETIQIVAQINGDDFIVDDLSSMQVKAFKAEGYRPQICYGKDRNKKTYGGKLLENICQAIGCDLMRHALKEIDKAGLTIRLHVHDEIVTEVETEEECRKIERIMSTPPLWAQDLPLACEGFICDRFAKKPRKKKE